MKKGGLAIKASAAISDQWPVNSLLAESKQCRAEAEVAGSPLTLRDTAP